MSSEPDIDRDTYWRIQIRRTVGLLVLWFVAGFGLSIFFAEWLNGFTFLGMPLGFWMAQQGSIFVFVGLVLAYAVMTGRLDRRAGVDEQSDPASSPPDDAPHS